MNCIFDASALINLSNGGILDVILRIPNFVPRLGPQVLTECTTISDQLGRLIAEGRLTLIDDTEVPADQYLLLMERYALGAGETECLAFASSGDDVVCCDDRRARAMTSAEIGDVRVTGSIGLLGLAIHHELITAEDAFSAYELMRRRGAFLPELNAREFAATLGASPEPST